MKYVRFKKDGVVHQGILDGEETLLVRGDPFNAPKISKTRFSQKDITLIPPVIPTKIIAVGLNYTDHAKELNMPVPEEPIIFLKPPSAVIGPFETIYYPSQSKRVDYEAEMAIVIKKRAHHIRREKADEFIFGYTCLNDITARDLQKKDGQWARAKSFDTFCPIGPHIETEIDVSALTIESFVNKGLKQRSNTSMMIFDCNKLVEFISGIMTLEQGDIIATGTPAGVGPVKPGDVVTVRIENLGSLTNTVKTR